MASLYLPRGYRLTLQRGESSSAAVSQLIKNADPANLVLYTHFGGDALPGEWAAAAGVNGTVTVANSKLTLTGTTTDNDSAGQAYGLFWKGDRGYYQESRQALDTITTSKIEIGITDAVGDDGAVATKATPTATADDFCVLVRDTDDNTDLDLISELDNGGPAANAEGVYTVVGGTNFTTEFRYYNDNVAAFVNGNQVGTGSCQGGDNITPWFYVQCRAGSISRILTVEYLLAFGPDVMS